MRCVLFSGRDIILQAVPGTWNALSLHGLFDFVGDVAEEVDAGETFEVVY